MYCSIALCLLVRSPVRVTFHVYTPGLSPGGRVKLVCSACVDLSSPKPCSFALTSTITTRCLAFHPQLANHYYVGTDEVGGGGRAYEGRGQMRWEEGAGTDEVGGRGGAYEGRGQMKWEEGVGTDEVGGGGRDR